MSREGMSVLGAGGDLLVDTLCDERVPVSPEKVRRD